ncbi:MAG: CorA family divalent cation transporter [Acidobacteriota bacterium]
MTQQETIELLHLHTYFFFPFSIDKITVVQNHKDLWANYGHWIDGLDEWIASHHEGLRSPLMDHIGCWRRDPFRRFDMDSTAYQDMVFFHPYVRRVFFDIGEVTSRNEEREALLCCYTIPVPAGKKLWFCAEDVSGRSASVQVTDLRLFMFANGVGILSIGIEAFDLSAADALWINESFRKVYPSSRRQIREGRIPSKMELVVEQDGNRTVVAEEDFKKGGMTGYMPPLARTITSLLYFCDYSLQEFEPVLDERMVVNTYACLNPDSVPRDFVNSKAYRVFLSRLLYVDQAGDLYRYNKNFINKQLSRHLYNRWAHSGTYYGFTSYSSATTALGTSDCDMHVLKEGFLIHRMFNTRYYLMGLIALFYRATLLEFAERTALISKRIFRDWEDGKLSKGNVRIASDLRAEFLHFSNYWYFDELSNKEEEFEHFTMHCRALRVLSTKNDIDAEIEKLNTLLQSYAASRNTEAVNRLAVLSLIVGAGAILTGYFGMNFGDAFAHLFFNPTHETIIFHYTTVGIISMLVLGVLAFGLYMVVSNWSDYRDVLMPKRWRREDQVESSLKRSATEWPIDEEFE